MSVKSVMMGILEVRQCFCCREGTSHNIRAWAVHAENKMFRLVDVSGWAVLCRETEAVMAERMRRTWGCCRTKVDRLDQMSLKARGQCHRQGCWKLNVS
jgi:hypothetical protein